jgi:hydrogenase-4 component B
MSVVFALGLAGLVVAVGLAARSSRACAIVATLACAALALAGLSAALGGPTPGLDLGGWLGFGRDELRLDPLAGLFVALTAILGAAVSMAAAELPPSRRQTALGTVLVLLVAAAIATGNGFVFLLVWEAISVCVYLLASSGRSREDLVAGYLTGVLAKVGGAALLAAVALLYADTHSLELAVWAHASLAVGTRSVLFALFLTCFATKLGIVPLQGAIPAGYGSAPRLGAAWMSVALCAGFYGLWRFAFEILGPLPAGCGDALLVVGAVSAVLGVVYALIQSDLRRFLGYSTVEHAGVVLVGLGVALLGQAAHAPVLAAAGLLAATLHVCSHNLAKTLALITIDRVTVATGERTIDALGGLGRRLPISGVGLGLASLTLAAIPPLGGFVSEWFTFEALLQGFRMPTLLSRLLCALAAAALALTAGLGLLAFAKYYGFIFLGAARSRLARLREPSRAPLAVGALSVVIVFLGAAAPWEVHLLGAALKPLLGFNAADSVISHPLVLGPVFKSFSVLAPTWLSIALPAYVLLALLVVRSMRGRSVRGEAVRRAPVWLSGSAAELAAVQYRPAAYSNPMRVILRGPLGFSSRLVGVRGGGLRLETATLNTIERRLYAPLASLALSVTARVRALQSGRLSAYLLYMLIALILALALVPILR